MIYLPVALFYFIVAFLLAILEIQIEGRYGWASRLPTWRPEPGSLVSRLFGRIMGGKPATGYHLILFSFVLLLFHWPYVYGWPLTLSNWLRTISLFFSVVVLWDFLWFVLNPAYPLKFFQKETVAWHKKWWGRIPLDYIFGLSVSLVVLVPLLFLGYGVEPLGWWLINNSLFGLLTCLVVILSVWRRLNKF
ncbi:hypothetical protein KKC17_02145 [Patescibacteria group bacterium]|nr:hypothetical protein [Patescibacteria group bacterium]